MRNRDQIDEGEIQRLLEGSREPEPREDGPLAEFVSELRSLYVQPPSEEVERVHVAQAAAMARELADEPTSPSVAPAAVGTRVRNPMNRRRLALITAAAVVATPLTTVGLAFAGVSLPGLARAPFEELGIELPNQAKAVDVRSVIEATEPAERDCRFGGRVAVSASEGRAERNEGECDRASTADDRQGPGTAHQPDRRGGSDDAPNSAGPSGHSAGGARESARRDGEALGEEASEGARGPSGQPATSQGSGGQRHAEQGQANGQQQAEQGQGAGERSGHMDPPAANPPAPGGLAEPRPGVERGAGMPRGGPEAFQP